MFTHKKTHTSRILQSALKAEWHRQLNQQASSSKWKITEWLSYRRFGLRILCSLEDYIIQEGTENESPNALLKTLFYDSLFQSPESSPYRVLVENSGTKCFLSLLHKIIMFSLFFFYSCCNATLSFPYWAAWAASAFQSFNYPFSFIVLWWARCSTAPHTISVRYRYRYNLPVIW